MRRPIEVRELDQWQCEEGRAAAVWRRAVQIGEDISHWEKEIARGGACDHTVGAGRRHVHSEGADEAARHRLAMSFWRRYATMVRILKELKSLETKSRQVMG